MEAYKSLDELCKQILSSDRGISKYIDEMDQENTGRMNVVGWERDYKQLKRMRRIRNQLVHETNSFQENLINVEDIEWLKAFHSRIMKCTDPFSLLYQSRNTKIKTTKQEKQPKNDYKTNQTFFDWDLVFRVALIIGGIILVVCYLLLYC